MKNAAKYAVLALGPIVLIVGVVLFMRGGGSPLADSMLYYNILTGESQEYSKGEVGASVLPDDQGRQVIFNVVGEDGLAARAGQPKFIKERDHSTFDMLLERGEFTLDEVKVDPDTYMIIQ